MSFRSNIRKQHPSPALHRSYELLSWLYLLALLLTCAPVLGADWPPSLDRRNEIVQTSGGRRMERYTHGARSAWGYPDTSPAEWQYRSGQETGKLGQNRNSFYVVLPQHPRRHAPLCVVMHSANRTAFDYLGFQFLNRKVDPADDPTAIMTRVPDDCYALYLNSTNEEWWGWTIARTDRGKYATTLTPAEKRVLDTIGWAIARYKIDRNRVYLSGVSMGGCGALGLGLPHGDIFAAMFVDVPAGTEFAMLRLRRPPVAAPPMNAELSLGVGLPEPPVVVDFFAQNDQWSETQPDLLEAAQAGQLSLIAAWGPFGHTAFSTALVKYSQVDVALTFPWSEIRKNAAYPLFTNASSNQRPPKIGSSGDFDESGQMNAYFRWKSRQDKTSRFAMDLWLAHPVVANPPPAMPDTSTTDITLRRLQSFKVQPGKTYTWGLTRDGRTIASGRVVPDAASLLIIPRVTLSVTPATLSVEAEN
jgi:hypothetical protein